MPGPIPRYKPPWLSGDRHRKYNTRGRDPTLLKLYSTARWKRFRALIRAERVLCEDCKAEGRTVLGEHVHHLVDPRDNPDFSLHEINVRLLCQPCHNRVTAERRTAKQGRQADGRV
jgi:5-methylcytosine-specific restriction protein A